ncbi:hypothetical protein [Acinetobacter soli]|uniref:hypothetical protein n=1 Tax=Acinetobacter soli TaxID=487316 RepID=UPI00300C89F1
MELSTALLFIKNSFGSVIGTTVTLIVSIFIIYGFLIKTGVIEHISLITTYKRRKKDKLIASKEVLIKESRLDDKTKDQIIYHQKVLYLQIELGTEEKDLNKLEYLISFIDKQRAIVIFELCKHILVYDKNNSSLTLNKKYNINDANRNNIIGSIIYFSISALSIAAMLYTSYFFAHKISTINEFLILVILSTIILLVGVYIAFKILTYFMRLKYVKWLLEMERIG